MPLTNEERDRYARQIPVPGWGDEGQARLASARVLLAGAGGLGCAAATSLVLAGVGTVVIRDHDRIERSNLNRQFLYEEGDLGEQKAVTAAKRLAALNPRVSVEAVTLAIGADTEPGTVAGFDVLIDCLDNLESRFALNRIAIAAGVPLVHGAVSDLTGHVSFLSPPRTPCLQCFVPPAADGERPAVPSCASMLVGALEATEAIKFLTGIGDVLAGRLLVIEGAEPRFDVIAIERDPDCPACGSLR